MARNDREYDSANGRLHGLYMGYVKNTSDYQRMGRLDVWIPELTASDSETVTVVYGSPFAGASTQKPNGTGDTYDDTQKSYGFWAVPPDIDNIVLVMFINGHISRGVWIGCLYQQDMNKMVPNMSVGETFQQSIPSPTAEYNKKSSSASSNREQTRPYHKPHYEAIRNQGLKDDPIRGFSQHGARSEGTSKVSGFLSPKGHYWSIEDTDNDEKIRIRSRSGVQVLLDDSNGMLYMINKSGKGWVEIDDNGKIMIYGEEGIGMRSKGDINLRADNDLIFESGRNIVMKSVANTKMENLNYIHKTKMTQTINVTGLQSSTLGQQHVTIASDYQAIAGTMYNIGTPLYNLNSLGEANITAGAELNLNSVGNLNTTSAASVNINAGASANVVSTGALTMNYSSILQNVGGTAQAAKPADGATPIQVVIPDLLTFNKSDVTQPSSNAAVIETPILSINTIFPSHEPCPEHGKPPEKRID